MKKFFCLCSLFFFMISISTAEVVEIPFENGVAYIPQVNGQDDLNSVRIEYDNGDVFLGKGTADGYPIEGTLVNKTTQTYYTGFFDENEQYTGEGTLDTPSYSYDGSFKNGKFHGYGHYKYKETEKHYIGDFVNGKRHGQGKEYKTNSSAYYEGSWVNDLYHGQGYYVSESGTIYEGSFINGQPKGYGTKNNSDGTVLRGNWKDSNTVNGDNCTFIGNGNIQYAGSLVDGKLEGFGVYTDAAGNTYEGSFSGNQRTGIGQQIYKDGSVYTGYYFGNQRNGQGSFDFSNGMKYEGGFLDGTFYGTGYLSSEENDELTIIASDEWDSFEIPDNADGATTAGENTQVASILPKSGKILFSNGDMWEGYMSNGVPIAGLGIWTTQEERLAKMQEKNSHVVLASYKFNNQHYDLSSVYTSHEVLEIISSEAYLVGFNDFYKKHKGTIDKIIGGLQVVTAVLSVIPSPIQPIAIAVDIGLSVAQISLKTVSKAIDIYDVCVAGNQNLVPGMLKDYGKDVAWDALNIIFVIPGSGKAIGELGAHVAEGFGKAGQAISKVVGKAISKNPMLARAAQKLGELGTVGKGAVNALAMAAEQSQFFQFVVRNGGKLTQVVRTAWIRTTYPELFSQYGDDATRLLFKYGNDISQQLTKNGDIIIRATKTHGDEVARIFIKNGDNIAKVARASEYPDAVIKYIKNSSNTDEAIKLVANNPLLGKVVNKYGDDAIKLIDKYGDDCIRLLDNPSVGEVFARQIKNQPPEQHAKLYKYFCELSSGNIENIPEHDNYCRNILDQYERLSLEHYTGSEYDKINKQLRGVTEFGQEEVIKNIDKAIKNAPPLKQSFVTHRGSTTYLSLKEEGIIELSKYNNFFQNPSELVGKKLQDSAFTSTSLSGEVAEDFINMMKSKFPNGIEIQEICRVPKGFNNGLYIDSISIYDEVEFLLGRNVEREIIAAEIINGRLCLYTSISM